MRRFGWMVSTLLILHLLSPGACAAGQQEATPVPQQIDREMFLQLERSILLAAARQDKVMLDALVAPTFVLRGNPDVDRNAWIKSMLSGCWSERFDIDRFDARPAGPSVVTSFIVTLYRDPETCRAVVLKGLVTSVWAMGEDHWQLAFRQAMPPGTVAAQWMRQQFTREAERPIRLDGKAQLSFVATTGNASAQTIGTGGELGYRDKGWATAFRTSFVSTRTDKGNQQSFGVDLRESHSSSNRVEVYAHAAFLRDEFAGIDQRYAADAGFGYPLVRAKRHALKFDAGLGYTHEVRFTQTTPAFPTAVLSTIYTWSISPTSSLQNEARVTGNLKQAKDWRLVDSLSVTIGLSRMLALKLSDKLNYLNSPVPGFVRTDTVLSAALVVQFAK